MLSALIFVFLVSLLATLIVIRLGRRTLASLGDHDLSGPQKFHSVPVPRVGGLGIMIGMIAALLFSKFRFPEAFNDLLLLTFCALPAFLSGLAEDVTKNVSPSRRLAFTALSAVCASYFLGATISRTGLSIFDLALEYRVLALVFTVLVVAGVTNAINIIDGFNGLASMCVMMMGCAVAFVAYQVSDSMIMYCALALVGAVLGFFMWNFPGGLIFLGDGGAYFLGFFIAELGLLLVVRHAEVSPYFPVLLFIYPIFETLFSIYRKRFLRNMSPSVPDGVHLHMLVYKRLMRWVVGRADAKAMTRRNSLTSPYLWVLCMLSVVPSVLFWDDTFLLLSSIAVFIVSYSALYWKIVRFRSPRWLVFRR